MKVKVTQDSHILVQDIEYNPGDELSLSDDAAKVQIEAGIVEEVKSKSKKGSK